MSYIRYAFKHKLTKPNKSLILCCVNNTTTYTCYNLLITQFCRRQLHIQERLGRYMTCHRQYFYGTLIYLWLGLRQKRSATDILDILLEVKLEQVMQETVSAIRLININSTVTAALQLYCCWTEVMYYVPKLIVVC